MEIKASVVQYERNKTRQRIQTKMEGKRAHGELCGTLSYGWNVRYHFTDGHELLVSSHCITRAGGTGAARHATRCARLATP
jgi:hypothetical protein